MGGMGSGRTWGYTSTVESARCIDLRTLKKRDWLKPGFIYSLSWTCGGEPSGDIKYRAESDALVLLFKYRENRGDWESVEQRILMESTPCNYGGYRQWFVCPHCSRRCLVLCGAGKLFLCRQCYRLPYQSQLDDEYSRLLTKRRKLEEMLWGDNRQRMWQRTRDRLCREYDEIDARAHQVWASQAAALMGIVLPD